MAEPPRRATRSWSFSQGTVSSTPALGLSRDPGLRTGQLRPTGLRTDELRDMLRQCKATQKLMVLDCCHSGGERGIEVGSSSQELGASFQAAQELITLASCQKQETSREWEAKGHGLFTYFLAEGLSGAADLAGNKDGLIDSDELYNYTVDHVSLVGQRELNAKQTPVRVIGEDVVGRFLLTRIAPSGKIRVNDAKGAWPARGRSAPIWRRGELLAWPPGLARHR